MSNPSPNRPRNLFGNNTNPNIDETITPPTNTGVEPSPIAVPDRENVASITRIQITGSTHTSWYTWSTSTSRQLSLFSIHTSQFINTVQGL